MTYEQFLNIIHSIKQSHGIVNSSLHCFNYPYPSIDRIDHHWKVGGVYGGNCWGDDAESWYDLDQDNYFTVFKAVLRELGYKLSQEQRDEIERVCVEKYTHCDNEYYGNYTDYEIHVVYLPTLYKKMGFVE